MADQEASPAATRRQNLNRRGYRGEQISINAVLAALEAAAVAARWDVGRLMESDGRPVWCFRRSAPSPRRQPYRVYVSAGIHGDEPAGPLAALGLLREDTWPDDAEIVLFPCLNPAGIAGNRRETPEGIDPNRDYRNPKTALVQKHLAWFESEPRFTVGLLLHEDWEADGFYLYELIRPGATSVSQDVIRAIGQICPVLQASQADDWPATNGIIRPKINPEERREWPEALYVFMNKADQCYTFEAPSDYPLATRVSALIAAVHRALREVGLQRR